jgi:hypothetical protein
MVMAECYWCIGSRDGRGNPVDAFPWLPGYGFSGKPDRTGWGVERIARAWTVLMERLG